MPITSSSNAPAALLGRQRFGRQRRGLIDADTVAPSGDTQQAVVVQALQRPRRRLGEPAPAVHRPLAAETLLPGRPGCVGPWSRTKASTSAASSPGTCHRPEVSGSRGCSSRVGVARHEAVGVEEILLQPEPGEAPFQIARPIAGHTMPQDQILGARRRPNRIGLHEARRADRARQRRRRRQRTEHRLTAQRLDGELAGHPIQRADSTSCTRSAGRHRRTPRGPITTGRSIRIGCARIASISSSSDLALIVQAHGVVRRATPPQQLASRYVHAPQHARAVPAGWAASSGIRSPWLDACLADHAQHLA